MLEKLRKEQPLFTPDWERWTRNRREVPLAGTWTVTGHETGRGDVWGTLELTRTEADGYDGAWTLNWSDGSSATRTSKGILYAGYSWRGRAADGDTTWREVLLLDDGWKTFRGRLFSGAYDEIGGRHAVVTEGPHPGMHRTRTIDYAIVLSGEIWAIMDEGERRMLPGDCLVQRGTSHAWSNRTDEPAQVAFILIGAEPL